MTITCINNIISSNRDRIAQSPKTPKNVNWRNFNLEKELIPIGKSGKVCLNQKPIKINRKWEKNKPEGCDVVYICGEPLFRLCGMIYWYSIGDIEFDIREMRRLANAHKFAKFKEDYDADHDLAHPMEGLNLVAHQWEKVLQRVESHWDLLGSPPPTFHKFKKLNYSLVGDDELPL